VAAAHHRERVRLMKVRGPGQLGDRDLARIDQVRIDVRPVGHRTHPEHAVLGVQHDPAARAEVVGDRGRLADPEVDVGTGCDALGHQPGQFVSLERSPVQVLDDRAGGHTVTTRST
jgi:hypothetical protein